MSIEDQIAEAQAAAKNAPTQGGAVATTNTGGALAQPAAGGAVDMSFGATMSSGGLQPDAWLNVNETGIRFDKANKKEWIDEFVADVDFSQVKLFVGLRTKQPGNKQEYIKSYDGKAESRSGTPWPVAMQQSLATAVEPADQYRGADILFVAVEDVAQGKEIKPAGTKFGHTTPVTGFGAFQAFLNELVANGDVEVIPNALDPQGPPSFKGTVRVKVTHIEKSNANYSWGILGYEKA